jgi:hypothetical protein
MKKQVGCNRSQSGRIKILGNGPGGKEVCFGKEHRHESSSLLWMGSRVCSDNFSLSESSKVGADGGFWLKINTSALVALFFIPSSFAIMHEVPPYQRVRLFASG